ncbi:MAG: hypothetical protein VYC17_05310, partial [Nitrospinota bacterium]|nr:hypothetical protein [Nitrospinota bacterium]
LTFGMVYKFAEKYIGKNEAAISLLLAGVSYYSIHNCIKPIYGGFYVFASFMTFYFLWRAFEDGRGWDWFGFALINFLNLTESLLAGILLPALFAVGLILTQYQAASPGSPSQAKKKGACFVLLFCGSVVLALGLYQVRGLNLFEQVFNMVFSQIISPEFANDDVAHVFQKESMISGFGSLFHGVFFALNFEYYEFPVGKGINDYLRHSYWIYFLFFLAGLWAFYKKNKKLFWCFFTLFSLPTLGSAFILRLAEARYLAGVLSFYWITVAAGFVYLISQIQSWVQLNLSKTLVVLLAAFLTFSWFLHPRPLWSSKYHDEMFNMYGIKAITDYLSQNIKAQDVILNVTDQVRLESFRGGPIPYIENKLYLEPFHKEHRLMGLLERKGTVGVWVILKGPIQNEKLLPYYFPRNYQPHLVKQVNGFALYYGQLALTETQDVEQDEVFSTPFWLFLKALHLHRKDHIQLAESYYQKMIAWGFNVDRAYYNLGLLYGLTDVDKGIHYLRKAIEEIQSPTRLPENAFVGNIRILISKDDREMPFLLKDQPEGLRYYFVVFDGKKYKAFFREDFFGIVAAVPYSEYYMAGATFFYFKFLQTKEPRFLKEARVYADNVLKLNPNHRERDYLGTILAENPGSIPEKKPVLSLGNLNFIREEFPQVTYE